MMRRDVARIDTVKSIVPTMDGESACRPMMAASRVASETVYCMDESDCSTVDLTVALDRSVETMGALVAIPL